MREYEIIHFLDNTTHSLPSTSVAHVESVSASGGVPERIGQTPRWGLSRVDQKDRSLDRTGQDGSIWASAEDFECPRVAEA